MANWTKLPGDKIFHQPDQESFLAARRQRICLKCKNADGTPFEYQVIEDIFVCPKCELKGIRMFERLCIIAGRRWGKTVVGSLATLEEACIPNSTVWCCAPSNPKLHRYIIPAMQKLIPPEWVTSYNSEYGDLRLKNGSLIHFQTLEDPDQGRGQGLDALWIDEVCELTKAHWDVIRPSLGDKQGVAFFTTSPRSYDWVWKLLYKPALDGVPGHYGLHARTIDNPLFQSAQGKAFIERERLQMSDEMFRQEYEADFVNFTGAVYGSLLEPQILRTNESIREIIPEWPQIAPWRQVLVGIDTGADHPFGAVKLVSTDKGLVVVGEYLARNKTFQIHANSLHYLAPGSAVRWAINKNEKQQTLELAQHGIYCAPAENDVVSGTERVKSWLGAGQLYFVENLCPITIEQMRTYRWAENTSPKNDAKRTEKVYKKDDELPDCFIAGTQITTARGDVAVENLQVGDKVLTRDGFKEIEYAGSRVCPLLQLSLADGTVLHGTATHPIHTSDRGFVSLQDIRVGESVSKLTQIIIVPGLVERGLTRMVPSLMATKSIISTVIKPITALITWLASRSASIRKSTGNFSNPSTSSAFFVKSPSSPAANTNSIAQPSANRLLGVTTRLTTKLAPAGDVAKSSEPIAMPMWNSVPAVVAQVITSVQRWSSLALNAVARWSRSQRPQLGAVIVVGSVPTGESARVYNIAVKDKPEYFANGVLVHNCLRYALMTWPQLPKVTRPDDSLRNISKLPLEMQDTILHMRKLNAAEESAHRAPDTVTGDFWGSGEEDPLI